MGRLDDVTLEELYGCRRQVYQTRWNRPATWMVFGWLKSDERDCNILEVGDSFFCWTEENLTRKRRIRLLEVLTDKFGEEVVVFLDRAGYFYASGSSTALFQTPPR